jgi:acetolactate synthase-1/2/3 large subunit
MAKRTESAVTRRGFLKGAATAAAGAAAIGNAAVTSAAPASDDRRVGPDAAPPPSPAQIERDAGNARPPAAPRPGERAAVRPGSDLMVQVLRDLGVEYVAGNPGSSFEGLQESIINYGTPPNKTPEFITALHEESAVTMAHGYGKATGRPMCALLHGTIGVQHGAMSIYQAYYDRTPALLIAGRDLGFIAAHSANDMAGMVRSFTKWDAQPKTLADSLTAIQRAYSEAITPPCGPTLVVVDIELQKEEARDLKVPAYAAAKIQGIDASQAREIARCAESPHCRRPSANARRRATGRATRRNRRRVGGDKRDAGADEFSAAASSQRSWGEHGVRLHARPRSARRAGFVDGSCALHALEPRHDQHRLRGNRTGREPCWRRGRCAARPYD